MDEHSLLGAALTLLLGAYLAVTAPARAATPDPLEARLDRELGVAGGLTSEETARRAVKTSFDLRARRAELLAAAADADRALLAYLPNLSVGVSYTRVSDLGPVELGSVVVAPGEPAGALPPDAVLVNAPILLRSPLNQWIFQASLLVPVSDYLLRVPRARAAALRARDAQASSLEASQARVTTDARVSYYGWVRARLGALVAEQALADARAHLADAQLASRAGSASDADVLRLQSQVARAELYLTSSRSLASLTERQLRTAMHDDSERALAIGEDIHREPAPGGSEVARLEAHWAEASRHRPELRAQSSTAESLHERSELEKAAYVPRLDLFANATYGDPNPRQFPPKAEFRSSWLAGGRLTWDLTDAWIARERARAVSARAAAVLEERRATLDRIRVEVQAAAQAVDDSVEALSNSRQALESSRESYRVRRLLFQHGRSTSVELLDAETDLTRARLDSLNAEVDARVARARLAYAIGHAVTH